MKQKLFKILYFLSFVTIFFAAPNSVKAEKVGDVECTRSNVNTNSGCKALCFNPDFSLYNSPECKSIRGDDNGGGKPASSATDGCPENVVVNILDQECKKNEITAGGLTNRFVKSVPYVISVLGVIGIGRSSIKVMNAESKEEQKEGFKVAINTAIGAGLFYSIWMILYLIQQFTGARLIPFG